VTYSDINNAAMLMEVAARRGSYVPELSFGTHFFQDLVESAIRYLPIFPGEHGVVFNDEFLRRAPSVLGDLVPEYVHLAAAVRVIDVPAATRGLILRVLMNADTEEALGMFAEPAGGPGAADRPSWSGIAPSLAQAPPGAAEHWRWRLEMAERIAAAADPARFGIKAMYVFGSTKNATAGPASDIDLLVHVSGSAEDRRALALWLEGWSRALTELNYLRTGRRSDGLLDVHFVTDDDIARQSSYAAKIGAVTDPARPLRIASTPNYQLPNDQGT
ncbi:MAG TPA: nucleotidyltransferase domain-containing protein, partial [Vicinamibacterales bacterium]|nr:nucleotidyltransferase domain-containing protein [Vicinamibacterales bacterium]